ncbi:hypothetical protein [Streptomyces sp. RTd22]|uniref:hypothetical protein n=1 Tax=Streptomyces sp. RTd22 TaxID=1841249 RepID=UPI0007C44CE1|nr:hypothetical protein [Streptomyces sp. RTd22]
MAGQTCGDAAWVAELGFDEGDPACDLGAGEPDPALGSEATSVEDGSDGEPRGVEGIAIRVLDLGVFQIDSPFDMRRAEADSPQCHEAGCPYIGPDRGVIEL